MEMLRSGDRGVSPKGLFELVDKRLRDSNAAATKIYSHRGKRPIWVVIEILRQLHRPAGYRSLDHLVCRCVLWLIVQIDLYPGTIVAVCRDKQVAHGLGDRGCILQVLNELRHSKHSSHIDKLCIDPISEEL